MTMLFVIIDETPSCCTFEDTNMKLDSIYNDILLAKARVKELNNIGEAFRLRILSFELNTPDWEYYVDEQN